MFTPAKIFTKSKLKVLDKKLIHQRSLNYFSLLKYIDFKFFTRKKMPKLTKTDAKLKPELIKNNLLHQRIS